MAELIEAKSVGMYPSDWAIVRRVADAKDLMIEGNESKALRFIVRDWARRQQQEAGLRLVPQDLEPVLS